MKTIYLQVQSCIAVSITPGRIVQFEEIIDIDETIIEFDSSIGYITFKEPGEYVVDWSIEIASAIRDASIELAIVSSQGDFIVSSTIQQSGILSGSAAIEVQTEGTTLYLLNLSNTIILNAAPVAASLSVYKLDCEGVEGCKGPTGDKGSTGDKGPTGDTGLIGNKGETGDKGVTGDKGETGDMGPTGLPGAEVILTTAFGSFVGYAGGWYSCGSQQNSVILPVTNIGIIVPSDAFSLNTDGSVTVHQDGIYMVNVSLQGSPFDGSLFAIQVDKGGATPNRDNTFFSGGADVPQTSGMAIVTAHANQTISVGLIGTIYDVLTGTNDSAIILAEQMDPSNPLFASVTMTIVQLAPITV